jgi:hypothetical protein
MSFAATEVVHPDIDVLCSAVPVESAGLAEAVIVFVTVGIAVPVAIFQMSNVTVPASTVIFHAVIVQA